MHVISCSLRVVIGFFVGVTLAVLLVWLVYREIIAMLGFTANAVLLGIAFIAAFYGLAGWAKHWSRRFI